MIGVGNGDFEIVKEVKSQEFLEDMGACLEKTLSNGKINDIDRVAVAAAGPLDRDRGVFYPPNIDLEEVQIKRPLEAFGDVRIVNDCTAAVLGEYYYGDHSVDNLLYVTISSGIGAGLIVDGNLVEGWNGNFGEVGHMQVGEDSRDCGCGGEDHWEAYCSGNSLPRTAEKTTGEDFRDARQVFEKAGNGDKAAEKTLERMNEINAKAFANLVNLYNPEKIVLGGAVALNHPEEVIEPILPGIKEQIANEAPEVEKCTLEEEAVLHGLRAACNGKPDSGCGCC